MQEALEQWKQMAWARESGIGEQEFPAGALYIVGLPIGNAADITIRALWTLAIADCVYHYCCPLPVFTDIYHGSTEPDFCTVCYGK